jgi:hypothetical protein
LLAVKLEVELVIEILLVDLIEIYDPDVEFTLLVDILLVLMLLLLILEYVPLLKLTSPTVRLLVIKLLNEPFIDTKTSDISDFI